MKKIKAREINFNKEYETTIQEVLKTSDGVRLTIDIKKAKQEGIELEQRGKNALFRSILKNGAHVAVKASDFVEEII